MVWKSIDEKLELSAPVLRWTLALEVGLAYLIRVIIGFACPSCNLDPQKYKN